MERRDTRRALPLARAQPLRCGQRLHQAQRSQLAVADRQAEDPDRLVLRKSPRSSRGDRSGTCSICPLPRKRLAAAGARPQDIDFVMCTHLHHDHVGWNTQLRDGRWVPTFPNARYVFSKPDFDHYRALDAGADEGPVEFGTFRECVLPIVEAGRAELVTGACIVSMKISKSCRRRATRRGTSSSSSKAAAHARSSSAMSFIICCRSITRIGISRKLRRRAGAHEPQDGSRGLRVDGCCPVTSVRVRGTYRCGRRRIQAALVVRR